MRPVLLDLDGFGSFRSATTVDFRDADYFALVGPTGAGKSTVVDAIVFALYGSVPRWDNRRSVSWALAPTAGRGVVRLVFDAGGSRYVVSRELRRAASGTVSVRNARLERIAADGTGTADERSDVQAADSEVTPAVERLLGLTYDHFVRCVILPQGDFARFLHSTTKERQDTLVDLLGIRVYREVATRSRSEEAAQRQRSEFAARRLEAYADATPEAAAAAGARIDAVTALAGTVATAVPALVAAGAAVAAAEAEVGRLAGEQARLAALRVPAGLDDLAAGRREAAAALTAADAALAVAEKADTAAREELAAAPARGPLERARDAAAELDRLTAARPALDAAHAEAAARLASVVEAGRAARLDVDAARTAREAAVADRDRAREAARAEEARQREAALAEESRLREAAIRADAVAAVRAHLVPGEPCPVCDQVVPAGRGDHDPGAIPGLDLVPVPAGRSRRPRAAAVARPAVTVPAAVEEAVTAAERQLRTAEAAVERLQRDWQTANRDAERAAARLQAATDRTAELAARTEGHDDVLAALRTLDGLEAAARDADEGLRAARKAKDRAARAVADADARLTGARAELDRARDPLVPLGAPPPARDDLVADWLALAEWALAAAGARTALLADAERTHAGARAELGRQDDALRTALAGAGVAVPPGRALAEAAEPAVAAALAQARQAAERIAERRREAAELRQEQAAADEAAQVAKLLGLLLKADGFERWLLTSALDVLVTDAAATLLELSGGQFELAHDGKDFVVVDHTDADSVRPVRTLSGGETFQASLALALALSAQLAGLAAGGPARLDAIVLDEGFGTLDEATLDVVATTLESLTAGGERMVGVVTHVGALAERVPVRFAVSRGADGSRVERHDL